MEAKDTGQARASVKRYCIGEKHCNRCEVSDCFVDELAEISFQAGIREVVGWMEERRNLKSNQYLACFGMDIKEWQAKLKDWGL